MLILLTLGLFIQASTLRWTFPYGGAPNLVLAAVLLVGLRRGPWSGLITGLWGGFLVGALRGEGLIALALGYAAMGWLVATIAHPRPQGSLSLTPRRPPQGGTLSLGSSVLLAAAFSLVATFAEATLVGGTPMWAAALVSLAPQMLFQICLIALFEVSVVFL